MKTNNPKINLGIEEPDSRETSRTSPSGVAPVAQAGELPVDGVGSDVNANSNERKDVEPVVDISGATSNRLGFATAYDEVYQDLFDKNIDDIYEIVAESEDARTFAMQEENGDGFEPTTEASRVNYPEVVEHADEAVRKSLFLEAFDALFEQTKNVSQEERKRQIEECIAEPLLELLEDAVYEKIDDLSDDCLSDECQEQLTAGCEKYEYGPDEETREREKLRMRERRKTDSLITYLGNSEEPVYPPRKVYRRSLKQEVASRLFEQAEGDPIPITLKSVRDKAIIERCKAADVIFRISLDNDKKVGIYKGGEILESMAVGEKHTDISVLKIDVGQDTPEELALWHELNSVFQDSEDSFEEVEAEQCVKPARMDVSFLEDLREKSRELAWAKFKHTSKPERFNECLEDLGEFVGEWQSQIFELMDRAMKFNAGIRLSGLTPEICPQIDMLVTEFMEKLLGGEAIVTEMAKLIPRMGPQGLYFKEDKRTESEG